MNHPVPRRTFMLGVAAPLVAQSVGLPGLAVAQTTTYPTKPVHVICPFAPGGPSDALTRRIAQLLGERFGQTFIVENRAGASGAIGLNLVAKAPPDGYTIGYGSFSTLVLNPILNPSFPFRPETALTPVCFLGEQAFALVVSPSLGVSTLPQLVAKLKANPGKYNFSSPGSGLTQHILGELFKRSAGVDITHVPFQSDSQALQAVIADTVQMAFTNFALYKGLLDRVRVVAIAAPERSPQLAGVPTFQEQGVTGVDLTVWHAFFAPAGTPHGPIERIDHEVEAAFSAPELRTYYEQIGLVPKVVSLENFQRRFLAEIRLWKQQIPELKLKINT